MIQDTDEACFKDSHNGNFVYVFKSEMKGVFEIHVNFDLNKRSKKVLKKIEGIERVVFMSRYELAIKVGRLFNEALTIVKVTKKILSEKNKQNG